MVASVDCAYACFITGAVIIWLYAAVAQLNYRDNILRGFYVISQSGLDRQKTTHIHTFLFFTSWLVA